MKKPHAMPLYRYILLIAGIVLAAGMMQAEAQDGEAARQDAPPSSSMPAEEAAPPAGAPAPPAVPQAGAPADVEGFVGGEIEVESLEADSGEAALLDAIGNAEEQIDAINKLFAVDRVAIVHVSEKLVEQGKAKEALTRNADAIAAVRNAVQANALLYHAATSRSVLLENILAVEVVFENDVRIFVIGE